MNRFRNTTTRSIFLLITGITFLNMSFFLAEISALKSAYNKNMLENIARMFTASLSEEETDPGTTEGNVAVREFDFLEGNLYHLQFEDKGIAHILKELGSHSVPHSGYSQIFTPPPDGFRAG